MSIILSLHHYSSHQCLLFSHKGVLNSVMSLLLGFGSVNSVVLEPVVNQVILILMKLAVRERESNDRFESSYILLSSILVCAILFCFLLFSFCSIL